MSSYPTLYFNSNTNFASIKNVILIDGYVQDYEKFYNDVNSDTFPVVYTVESERSEILDLLTTNFSSIDRLAIVTNDALLNFKQFCQGNYFFTDDDLVPGITTFSPNCQFILNLITTFSIKNIDFLACRSLTYQKWKDYYALLLAQTGVIVGASDDDTGNIFYGGDWILESTAEDIKLIYWTNAIDSYIGTLATTITGSGTYTAAQLNALTWPVTIDGGTSGSPAVITITEDWTIDDASKYFIIGSDYVTINGSSNTFTVNLTSIPPYYPGLVKNGSGSTTIVSDIPTVTPNNGSVYNNVIIQNIKINSNQVVSSLNGWLCQGCFCNGGITSTGTATISNCSSNGDFNVTSSYKFAGSLLIGGYSKYVNLTNCYTLGGSIYGGGVLGASCNNCSATTCFSAGDIIGSYYVNPSTEVITFTQSSGGIFGGNSSNCTSTNCFSKGSISYPASGGGGGGGIYGQSSTSCSTVNCYTTGEIGKSGSKSTGACGGLYGSNASGGTDNTGCSVTNCFTSGPITTGHGGVVLGDGTFTTTNFYGASGTWSSVTALSNLTGTPTYVSGNVSNPVGTTWIANANDTYWFLISFMLDPVQVYSGGASSTITYGQSSTSTTLTVTNSVNFSIINSLYLAAINGSFSINTSSSVITFNSTTLVNTYNIYVYTPTTTISSSFYDSQYNVTSYQLIVQTANLTITATDQSGNYATAFTLNQAGYTYNPSELKNTDAISSITIRYNGNTLVPGTTNAGTYSGGIVPSNAVVTNQSSYNLIYVGGNLIINTIPLTITALNQTTTYGTTYLLLTDSNYFSSSGLVIANGDSISNVIISYLGSITVLGTTASGTYTNSLVPSNASGTRLSNYNITYSTSYGTLIVNKKNLTVIANNQAVLQGNSINQNNYSTLGLVNSDSVSSSRITFLGSTTVPINQTVGLYTDQLIIDSATGTGLTNYDITYQPANLQVNLMCYVEGTKILCVIDDIEQWIEIEKIPLGTQIKTYKYGNKKVLARSKITYTNSINYSKYKIFKLSKEKNNDLFKDIYLSGKHSLLVDELTEEQKRLTLNEWSHLQKIDDKYLLMSWINPEFDEVKDDNIYNLYQITLESNNIKQQYGIYANGILSESLSIYTLKIKGIKNFNDIETLDNTIL